ncbi:Ig-like domain-containing protein, partial [Microcoleus sp. AT13-A5]|uniref:Ig-like domain-containing protein n=1 Tax=Microcoleus sp. AT13-A5 TaxID=2818590 RepID=UPI002FD4F508
MNVPTMNKQIIFVDSSVKDYQSLIQGIDPAQIVILNENSSAIDQITNALATQKDIEAVHILSHGSDGTLFLGNSPLDKTTLETHAATLQKWGKALKLNADILLYGCNVAQTEQGKAFVKRLSQLTKANVAASTTLTGNAKLGGDWNLDFIIGKIQAALTFSPEAMRDYSFVLTQLVNETFTGASVLGPWIYAQSGAGVVGLTTSGTNTPLPNLNLGDTAGNGALRLTSATGNQSGFVLYNNPIPSTFGVNVTFDFFAYGGNGADGISFFLVNGTANPTTPGTLGSGLGYTNLTGGYVGVGFDEYGGFGNTGSDSVAIRGSVTNSNTLLQSTGPISGGIGAGSVTRNAALRRAQIILTPSTAALPNRLSVGMDLNNNGTFTDAGETIIAPFNITTSNGAVPITFKFGFASSTGDSTNIHEIRNVIYETLTAPVLNNTPVVTLSNILEDPGAPTGPVGTLISQLADLTGGGGLNNITDPDTGAVAGVAITAADTTNGSWFYTINGGTTWTALGTVSNTNARLLAANANTRIYFQPSTNYNGTVNNALTFRAWDQVSGTNGGTADTSNNGGNNPFSIATDTAAITVTPVNDQPSFTATNPVAVNQDSGAKTVTSWATFNPGAPNESAQTATYTVSNISNGALFSAAPTINPSGNLTYTPAPNAFGTSTFDVRVQDSGGIPGVDTSAVQNFSITVNPAPTITNVSLPANKTYIAGETLDFTLTFSEAVIITGSPELPITLNSGVIVNATLNGTGASATTHNFRYNVVTGNLDSDGITVSTALSLPTGATIQNATSANAILTFTSGSTTGVLVDAVVPAVPSITTTAGTTNDTTPTLAGTAEPNSTVNILQGTTPLGTATADASGNWTFTPTTALADGTYAFTATAKDAAGNVSAASTPVNLTIDATASSVPTFTTTAGTTNDTTPTLAGTAEANSTVNILQGTTALGTATADATGNWTFTPTTALAEGPYAFTATATDAAGNTSGASTPVNLTIDATASSAPTITTAAGTTSDTTPTLAGTAEANSTVNILQGTTSLGTATADASGNWTFTPTTALTDGAYAFTATATDAAGNTSGASTPVNLTIDATASSVPTFTTTAGTTNDTTPTLAGTAEANSTVNILQGTTPLGTATADASGNWTFTPTTALADGTYAFTATAKDAAGNVSAASTPVNLTIDATASSVPTFTTTAGTTNDTTPTLAGTAEANSTVNILQGTTPLGTATADASGNWTFTPTTALADGTYAFTATAKDAAGNVSAASTPVNLTIDATASSVPTFTTTAGTTNDTTPTLAGTAEANSTVNILQGTTPLGTATADASGNWT